MKNCFKTIASVAIFAVGMGTLAFAGQTGAAQDTSSTVTSTAKAKHKRKSADSTATAAATATAATPAAVATPAPAAATPATKSATPAKAKSEPVANASDADIAAAKSAGKVWVNTASGAYHKTGRYYGKTKQGKFMTEDDAKKAGFHEVKGEIGVKKS